MTINLSPDNREWLSRFVSKFRRAPRILHIGNIANNAYNNAKILGLAGIESDVICYDYYHIMACPEWEDADFSESPADDFRPNWADLNIKDFQRPRWFAQGSLSACLEYLKAKSAKLSDRSDSLWVALGKENMEIQSYVHPDFSIRSLLRRFCQMCYIAGSFDPTRLYVRLYQAFMQYLHVRIVCLLLASVANLFIVLMYPFIRVMHTFTRVARRFLLQSSNYGREFLISDFEKRSSEIINDFRQSFPDRSDQLVDSDISVFFPYADQWFFLMQSYDYIIAYSTDPFLPYLVGRKYFAFEHGTLRDIPFEASPQGRRTALSYRRAEHVFVTNFDCRQNAELLAPGRFTIINHPFDEDHGNSVQGWEKLRSELKAELDSDVLFFFPTRQDWVSGTGYADKANDLFLRAFAKVRANGLKVGLVCCSWGKNVDESQALLRELNCDKYVKWERPMAIVRFERMAKACNCVVDQFKLGAFGGVLFKAMAVGAPVLTYLDEEKLLEQYAEVPPVINCQTEEQIFDNLILYANQPELLASKGKDSRAWIKAYHSKDVTVNAQIDQFR